MATHTTTTARSVTKAAVALVVGFCLAIGTAACAKEFKVTEWYGDFYSLGQPVNATDGDVRDASDIISGDAPTLQFRCEGENTVMRLETTGFTATNDYNRVVVDIDIANKDGGLTALAPATISPMIALAWPGSCQAESGSTSGPPAN